MLLKLLMVAKLVRTVLIQNCLWVLLVSSLTRATDSDINCLKTIKSQLKDPNRHLSNWVIGDDTSQGFICKFRGVRCFYDGINTVISIDLGGFGLEGELPSGLKECSSLQHLDLSGNKLYGNLPPQVFSFLPFLVTLDLSNNSFSGEIPGNFSANVYLTTLLLDHNHFTGEIPPTLAWLLRFSVSHNNLIGPIPRFTYANISASDFSNNPGLCGFPLDPCSDISLFSIASITAACAAAVCFPLGAAIGWFCVGERHKQRP
ncbi:unnamed protein product [Microthlaspi erraticum]|uniref:Leucine-rich repeat-containing N-terminal plant-type domain-containing protein n=1 Tax=Microthlaspi erraticum TaxID=1685480 RepID=A0A6D2K9G4_9BRAS|nr:unnamed protein product [Microthlaspi erraticum]CAA7058729.1 unnamed protein product [Microthlaspi erraticum]